VRRVRLAKREHKLLGPNVHQSLLFNDEQLSSQLGGLRDHVQHTAVQLPYIREIQKRKKGLAAHKYAHKHLQFAAALQRFALGFHLQLVLFLELFLVLFQLAELPQKKSQGF
jgi:hypothetical protein